MNLLDLNEFYNITVEKIDYFKQNGHVLLRNVCSKKEITVYRDLLKKTSFDQFPDIPKMDDRPEEDFSRAFIQTFNLHEHDPSLKTFCLSPRFGKISADLMQVRAVRLYYNKAMFKEPSSWITPWHQDGPHWPITSNNMLTMWIALVDITLDMGPIRFASKTHKNKYFGPKGISKQSESFYDEHIKSNHCGISEMSLKAGDATVHNHWTIHGAGCNKTKSMREVIAITMYQDGLKIDQSICQSDLTMMPMIKQDNNQTDNPATNKEENSMNMVGMSPEGTVKDPFFGGRIHGEIANSKRNPLLFIRS